MPDSAAPPLPVVPGPLTALIVGVVLFTVCVAVTVVVMAILHAVLPATDTGAEEAHERELELAGTEPAERSHTSASTGDHDGAGEGG